MDVTEHTNKERLILLSEMSVVDLHEVVLVQVEKNSLDMTQSYELIVIICEIFSNFINY